MAEIDRALFAVDVRHALEKRDLSYRHAVLAWPVLNVAMLSRACSEQVLSAGNFLALCQVFELDPFRYLAVPEIKRNQTVSAIVSREAGSVSARSGE
jgi:hypothetical protein